MSFHAFTNFNDLWRGFAYCADANNLRGVIDNVHFNDEDKLGKGKEMVKMWLSLQLAKKTPECLE